MLPNIVNADVVDTFISSTTCKSLVHKLGCQKPRTTRELLDIATNHASGEEVIRTVFTPARGLANPEHGKQPATLTPHFPKQGGKKKGN